jgi:hypothetical protein
VLLVTGSGDTIAPDGLVTLREAIASANGNANINTDVVATGDYGADTIDFAIGVPTINVLTALPDVSDPLGLTIDGTTQPGFAGTPLIEIHFNAAGPEVDGLHLTAGANTIRSLVINHFTGDGIQIDSDGNTIAGNYIGTNRAGDTAVPNALDGVFLSGGAHGNTIGGTSAGERNLISGNSGNGVGMNEVRHVDDGGQNAAVEVGAHGNLVVGNYIGTDAAGTAELGNSGSGVLLAAGKNTIGGSVAGARNIISGNAIHGVHLIGLGASGNLVAGNFIGTDVTGSVEVGNTGDGVLLQGAPDNTVGGTTAGARNIISGNRYGVHLGNGDASGNLVAGNYIGTDVAGTSDLGNSHSGVLLLGGSDNTIGGTTLGARNLISGNDAHGVEFNPQNGPASGNLVSGNFIGTEVTGTGDLGNSGDGVLILGASDNTIGGPVAGARNIISGNGSNGVEVNGGLAIGNLIEGNYIGTNVTGADALGNAGAGVLIGSAPDNTIGGAAAGARNVISGNVTGVAIDGLEATGNLVLGNYIGTDATGKLARGNSGDGVLISNAAENTVGGATVAERNLISANGGQGVEIRGTSASGNLVAGNYIGTDLTGNVDLGNAGNGVLINNAPGNTIGSAALAGRNVISGNGASGILIASSGATGNLIQSNFIGTDAAGRGVPANIVNSEIERPTVTTLTNGVDGIRIESASDNIIGGADAGAGNRIAFLPPIDGGGGPVAGSSGGAGVSVVSNVSAATGNLIAQNSIFVPVINVTVSGSAFVPVVEPGVGIDLGGDGVTSNDALDTDEGGPNRLQNFPEITSVSSAGGTTTIKGAFNGAPDSTFTLEFFASRASTVADTREGQTFLTAVEVTTDENGDAFFTVATAAPPNSQFITATATDAENNTSEFSSPVQEPPPLIINGDQDHADENDVIRLVRNAGSPDELDVFINNNSATPDEVHSISMLNTIVVNGLGGNDTLIIDSSNGLINVGDGIHFDGGAGFNSLFLEQNGGATHATDTFSIGQSAGEGTSVIAGELQRLAPHGLDAQGPASAQTAFFQHVGPVLDTVPVENLTVEGTSADNQIQYTQAAAAGHGLVAVDQLGSIEFSHKISLTIDGLAGNDQISLSNPSAPTDLTEVTVNGGASTAGDVVLISGTAAADTFTFSPAASDGGSVTAAGSAVAMHYLETELVVLDGLAGADRFVLGAATGSVKVIGGDGTDVLDFSTASKGVSIDLDQLGVGQKVSSGDEIVQLGDAIENFTGSAFNDTIRVTAQLFARSIDGGPHAANPPGDELIVNGRNHATTISRTDSDTGAVAITGYAAVAFDHVEKVTIDNSSSSGGFGGGSSATAFGAATHYTAHTAPRSVALADVNGDLILDMIVANSGSKDLSILLGIGDGRFGAPTHFASGGSSPTTVAIADFNHDSELDIAVTNRGSNNVGVLLGNGNGTFQMARLLVTHARPTSLKVADLDGDTNPDLVTANGANDVSVLLGNADGSFDPAVNVKTLGRGARDLVIGDFDGDQKLDLVVANASSNNVSFLKGAGNGTFTAPAVRFAVGTAPSSITSGDFNLDGILDVIVANAKSRSLSVLLGNGAAGPAFKPQLRIEVGDNSPQSILAADFNGDGRLDLALANSKVRTLDILLGTGNGTFGSLSSFAIGGVKSGQPVSIAVGDLDDDGRLDLAVAAPVTSEISVLLRAT